MKKSRLKRCHALLKRISRCSHTAMLCAEEKLFTIERCFNSQNSRMLSRTIKEANSKGRLFAWLGLSASVMVCADITARYIWFSSRVGWNWTAASIRRIFAPPPLYWPDINRLKFPLKEKPAPPYQIRKGRSVIFNRPGTILTWTNCGRQFLCVSDWSPVSNCGYYSVI